MHSLRPRANAVQPARGRVCVTVSVPAAPRRIAKKPPRCKIHARRRPARRIHARIAFRQVSCCATAREPDPEADLPPAPAHLPAAHPVGPGDLERPPVGARGR